VIENLYMEVGWIMMYSTYRRATRRTIGQMMLEGCYVLSLGFHVGKNTYVEISD
jgi:hypothetical protein